jgi:hypothetical protein
VAHFRAIRVSNAAHSTALPTLHEPRLPAFFKEGEGFEPPGPEGRVRFRNGCLTIQPTLRCSKSSVELSDELLLISHLTFSIVPRVGVEPTRKRFLRPPPLPLGYRGWTNAML